MNTSTFGFGEIHGLTSSEYLNLFGDPFWGESSSLKTREVYLQLSEKEKALMLKANYIKMIEKARERNFNMAADCLQWWLDGTGATKTIDFHWLRKQREVISAENVNIERFEKDEDSKLGNFLQILEDGIEPQSFSTHYDKLVRAGIFGELYYASGNSTLRSRCNFKITKKKNNHTLSGEITHSWNDRYDWNKGASAYIYGFGIIKDSDALLVEKYCGAKPFEMRSQWKQSYSINFQFNSSGDLYLKLN